MINKSHGPDEIILLGDEALPFLYSMFELLLRFVSELKIRVEGCSLEIHGLEFVYSHSPVRSSDKSEGPIIESC